jgi:hypothetical protein
MKQRIASRDCLTTDEYGGQFVLKSFFDEDTGLWISYARNKCCKHVEEVGWHRDEDVIRKKVVIEEVVKDVIYDEVIERIPWKFYRCSVCGEMYDEDMVKWNNTTHDYSSYNAHIDHLSHVASETISGWSKDGEYFCVVLEGLKEETEHSVYDETYRTDDFDNEIEEEEVQDIDVGCEEHTHLSYEYLKLIRKASNTIKSRPGQAYYEVLKSQHKIKEDLTDDLLYFSEFDENSRKFKWAISQMIKAKEFNNLHADKLYEKIFNQKGDKEELIVLDIKHIPSWKVKDSKIWKVHVLVNGMKVQFLKGDWATNWRMTDSSNNLIKDDKLYEVGLNAIKEECAKRRAMKIC